MAFTSIIALAAFVAAVSAGGIPAARYPAGVNPAACPNYPYCDPLVDPRGPGYAAVVASPYAYAGAAGYAYGAGSPYGYAAAPVVLAAAGGAKYPAGVNPAECPNYPYCHDTVNGNHAVGTYKSGYSGVVPVAAALAHGHYGYARQYPAGVSPAACPNYPYCH